MHVKEYVFWFVIFTFFSLYILPSRYLVEGIDNQTCSNICNTQAITHLSEYYRTYPLMDDMIAKVQDQKLSRYHSNAELGNAFHEEKSHQLFMHDIKFQVENIRQLVQLDTMSDILHWVASDCPMIIRVHFDSFINGTNMVQREMKPYMMKENGLISIVTEEMKQRELLSLFEGVRLFEGYNTSDYVLNEYKWYGEWYVNTGRTAIIVLYNSKLKQSIMNYLANIKIHSFAGVMSGVFGNGIGIFDHSLSKDLTMHIYVLRQQMMNQYSEVVSLGDFVKMEDLSFQRKKGTLLYLAFTKETGIFAMDHFTEKERKIYNGLRNLILNGEYASCSKRDGRNANNFLQSMERCS
tara:strand:- start:144 stop:1196 length:1053 start_codon:yes stop_codon:yes gene_type:complete